MPKQREAGFRKIFAAPAGQLVLALDYNQIELRAVGELISDWFGVDSILRQSFAAGMDAHTATAMLMTGKNQPEDITADERQLAKPCDFGLLYATRRKLIDRVIADKMMICGAHFPFPGAGVSRA